MGDLIKDVQYLLEMKLLEDPKYAATHGSLHIGTRTSTSCSLPPLERRAIDSSTPHIKCPYRVSAWGFFAASSTNARRCSSCGVIPHNSLPSHVQTSRNCTLPSRTTTGST